jgi:hypothetical protein
MHLFVTVTPNMETPFYSVISKFLPRNTFKNNYYSQQEENIIIINEVIVCFHQDTKIRISGYRETWFCFYHLTDILGLLCPHKIVCTYEIEYI